MNCPEVLEKAVTKRRAEFLAGRVLAKLALRTLGRFETDIPIGSDRAPVWPDGSAGSISHTRDRCVCLALPGTAFYPGVDVEALARGREVEAILQTVVNARERAIIEAPTSLSAALRVTLVFSAKETLFKALYPIVRCSFGFDSAELCAPPAEGRLGLRLTRPLHPSLRVGQIYDVRFIATSDHVLTWLAVPRP
ncbi:MAG: 4'-phosphopantetheinyl transferase superfamily protein [Pseudomonadota bacterium]